MQKKFLVLCLFLALSCAFVILGCTKPQPPRPVVIRAQQPQVTYVEATVIEGKTTKAEILEVLGPPDAFDKFGIAYYYFKRSPYEGAKIRCVQKDGTEYVVVLREGSKNTSIHFYITERGVVDYVSL